MKKGIIKECRYSPPSVKLKIEMGNRIENIEVSIQKSKYIKHFVKGKICEFEKKDKEIIKFKVEDVEIPITKSEMDFNSRKNSFSKEKSQKYQKQGSPSQGNGEEHSRDATAPYNFVPINKTVVSPPEGLPQFDRYIGYTGYIDLDIETLTPLYIRDAYTLEEDKKANKREGGKKWENPEFFSPQGKLTIPGSSLRGMVRNLVEIVSFSRMEYIDNSTFYYRTMGDKCKTVRDAYLNRMGRKNSYKFAAGYLFRQGNKYFIRPAKKEYNEKEYKRVKKANRTPFSYHWQENGSCITVSGPTPNEQEKKYDWLIAPPDNKSKPIELFIDDINAYRNDINRMTDDKGEEKKKDLSKRRDGDLFRMLELAEKGPNSPKMVPCFYIQWEDENKNERVSFGHTAYFRLAYKLSVQDHMPDCHVENNKIDFAQIIFGNTNLSAGKVFFEDAKVIGPVQQYEELFPKILSNPKPTTFQHYLEQGNAEKGKLKHWGDKPDDETGTGFIRGHKLYWHRKTPRNGEYGWEAEKEAVRKHPLQYTKIKPVKEGSKFKGRIRFENLSDIELGALLFVLNLPPNCAHKLGMGKPLGLGSVKITPHLVITDRSKGTDENPGRYGRLFDNKKWYLPSNEVDSRNFYDYYIEKFSKYILDKLGEFEYKDLWDLPRLKELRTMLSYDGQKIAGEEWLKRTKYMELEKFKERAILDSPSSILNKMGMIISKGKQK